MNQHKFILSQFWSLEVPIQGVCRMFSWSLGKNFSSFVLNFSWSGNHKSSLVWRYLTYSNLYFHRHMTFFPVALCVSFPPFNRIPVIGFMANLNWIWLHLTNSERPYVQPRSCSNLSFWRISLNPLHIYTKILF